MKDIDEFEGKYAVTKDGRVWSYPKQSGASPRPGRWMKQLSSANGYLRVCLTKDSRRYWRYIHRLVAFAYIPQVDGKKIINHIDGNKENNNVSNVEWSNHSDNLNHAYRNGLNKKPTLTKEQVSEIKTTYENKEMKQSEIAEQFGISQALVSKIIRKEAYLWQ